MKRSKGIDIAETVMIGSVLLVGTFLIALMAGALVSSLWQGAGAALWTIP